MNIKLKLVTNSIIRSILNWSDFDRNELALLNINIIVSTCFCYNYILYCSIVFLLQLHLDSFLHIFQAFVRCLLIRHLVESRIININIVFGDVTTVFTMMISVTSHGDGGSGMGVKLELEFSYNLRSQLNIHQNRENDINYFHRKKGWGKVLTNRTGGEDFFFLENPNPD